MLKFYVYLKEDVKENMSRDNFTADTKEKYIEACRVLHRQKCTLKSNFFVETTVKPTNTPENNFWFPSSQWKQNWGEFGRYYLTSNPDKIEVILATK